MVWGGPSGHRPPSLAFTFSPVSGLWGAKCPYPQGRPVGGVKTKSVPSKLTRGRGRSSHSRKTVNRGPSFK